MRLLFLLTTLVSSQALAAKGHTIAVVGLHDSGLTAEQQAEAVQQLEDVIESHKGFNALNQDEVSLALTGREAMVLQEAFLGPGRRLLEDGKILHDQAQPEDAIPVLKDAVQDLLVAMTSANASRDLWEAWVYLGSSHLALGNDKEAAAAFLMAVAINPNRQPNPAKLSPPVVQGYNEALLGAMTTPGELTVKVSGAATVFLNEKELGPAPSTSSDLPPGQVHVLVRGPDGGRAYRAVDIVAGEHTKLDLTLGEPSLGTAAQSVFGKSQQTTNLYKAIGKQAEVDLILMAGTTPDGKLAMQLYSPNADTFSRPLDLQVGTSSIDTASSAVGQLLDAVTDEGTVASIATTPNAAAMDVGANKLLTQILLAPVAVQPPQGLGLKGWQLAAGGAGLLAIGGGITAGVIAGARGPDHGTIIVGPVP